MVLRVRGVSFSCSTRAIVLPDPERWHEPTPEELTPLETPMPMIDSTKVEGAVYELAQALRSGGATVAGHDTNRIKVTTPDGRSCFLMAKYSGNSYINEARRQLKRIGIDLDDRASVPTWIMPTDGGLGKAAPEELAEEKDAFLTTFGFAMSDGTDYLLRQSLASLRNDLAAHIKTQAEATNPGKQWQAIAEEAEAKLGEARKERDVAVADLKRQRDEARKRAEEAERQLADVRRSLSGLQTLFVQPGAS